MDDDSDSNKEAAKIEYSSPPCYAREFPGYFGEDDALHPSDLLPRLNALLEAQRASARVLDTCLPAFSEHSQSWARINRIQQNCSAHAAALSAAVMSLGGTPSTARGTFHDDATAFATLADRLRALNRHRQCVARQIDELIPSLPTGGLLEMLESMRLWQQTDIDVAACCAEESRCGE